MKKGFYIFLIICYIVVLTLYIRVSDNSNLDNNFDNGNNQETKYSMIYCYGTQNGIKKEYYISKRTAQYYEKIEEINIGQSINIYSPKEICFSSSKIVRTDKEIKNSLLCSDYTYEGDFEDRVDNLMFFVSDEDIAMAEGLECKIVDYERAIFSRYSDKSKIDIVSTIPEMKELAQRYSK